MLTIPLEFTSVSQLKCRHYIPWLSRNRHSKTSEKVDRFRRDRWQKLQIRAQHMLWSGTRSDHNPKHRIEIPKSQVRSSRLTVRNNTDRDFGYRKDGTNRSARRKLYVSIALLLRCRFRNPTTERQRYKPWQSRLESFTNVSQLKNAIRNWT